MQVLADLNDTRDLVRYARLVKAIEDSIPTILRNALGTAATREQEFRARFPALELDPNDALLVSWDEITRQHLSLCADWDRPRQAQLIEELRREAIRQPAEATLRALLVLAHERSDEDGAGPGGKSRA